MTDLDPMLREAMKRVDRPVDARQSLADERRRARRHNRRRMTATVGVMACTGVAAAALIIRRDDPGAVSTGLDPADSQALPSTSYLQLSTTTTSYPGGPGLTVDAQLVWNALVNARYDPAGATLSIQPPGATAAQLMPTPEQFGCTTNDCRALYTYVVWHEIAKISGVSDVDTLQSINPTIDFSQPPREGDVLRSASAVELPVVPNGTDETPTTISLFDGIMLIDGGAPAGAIDGAYQRLSGYNRTIVPGSGRGVEQTMVMPIGDNTSMATSVGAVFGIDGFDTWDPSLLAMPIQGMVAVVIGPDYFDRVATVATGATVSTTTSIG